MKHPCMDIVPTASGCVVARVGSVLSRLASCAILVMTAFLAVSQAGRAHAGERSDCPARWERVKATPASTAYLQGMRAPGVIAGEPLHVVAAESAAMVEAVLVRPGDPVRRGQPMFRLSSDDIDRDAALLVQDMQWAQQDVIKQRERARSIASNLQRHRIHPDLFAKNEIDSLEADRISADAEVKQAQLRLQQVRLKQASLDRVRDGLVVRAPRDGDVREVGVRPGARVQAGTTLASLSAGNGKTLKFAMPAASAAMLVRDSTLCVVVPEKHWIGSVRIDRLRTQMLDAGETVALETGADGVEVWPAGIAVDVLPPTEAK